jgi:hypothetical protein
MSNRVHGIGVLVGAGPVLSIPAVSGSTGLTTGFDEPVLSFVEGLRTNGWDGESCNLEGPPDGISRR